MAATIEHLFIPSADPKLRLSLTIFTPQSTLSTAATTPSPNDISTTSTDSPKSTKPPVIILAHGIGTIKEAGLYPFAHRFSAPPSAGGPGLAVILFDYRHWGQSDGLPRGVLSVRRELDDLRSVVAWARRQPERFDTERLVVWGSSFGAMHTTALLADDKRLVAGIAQCPCVDGYTASRKASLGIRTLQLAGRAIVDTIAGWCGSTATVDIALTGEEKKERLRVAEENGTQPEPVVLLQGREAVDGWRRISDFPEVKSVQFPNRIAARSLFSVMRSRPYKKARLITTPYFLVLPEWDNQAPLDKARGVASVAPGADVLRVKGGHFDMYFGGQSFEDNISGQIAFLRRVLG